MSKTTLAALIGSSLLASGCASVGNLTSIYRTPDLEGGRSVVLDAEQWAVLNIPWPADTDPHAVCAMPSPDALAAAAAAGGLNVEASQANTGSAGGAATFGIGESAASIGLRTQSIQLLRDAMYRLCESYANGAINQVQYNVMMRRHQNNMIAILAIEQLTGAVAAQNVAISAAAEASVLHMLMNEREARTRELANVDAELQQIEGELGDQELDTSRRTSLERRQGELRSRRQTIQTDISSYQTALNAVANGEFTGGDLVLGSSEQVQRGQVNEAVANAVREITTDALKPDVVTDLCMDILTSPEDQTPPDLRGVCLDRLREGQLTR
ncbi:MAG: hypothetical protein ABL864_15085 [Terricaulis sp.]